jgi:hypothetical protein
MLAAHQQDPRIVLYVLLGGGFAAFHEHRRRHLLDEITRRRTEPAPRTAQEIRSAPPAESRLRLTPRQPARALIPQLADVLTYANGDNKGALTARSWPLSREEWPPEHDTVAFVFPTVGPAANGHT